VAAQTDPAAELAKLLDSLSAPSDQRGGEYLAEKFGVEEWSVEFYQIIFSIVQRIEAVKGLLSSLDGFAHLAPEMNAHLDAMAQAFTSHGLRGAWKSYGSAHVNSANIQPLKMCSAYLRGHVSYPDLTADEQAEIIKVAKGLLETLREHQLEENDFIRQALIEGIEAFVFRMERLRWLGWGYSLESLKNVVLAYVALDSGVADQNVTPIAAAMQKKLKAGLKSIFRSVGLAKDVVDRADFALKAYGAFTLAVQAQTGIAGLIK
jgi:hypothetical protein